MKFHLNIKVDEESDLLLKMKLKTKELVLYISREIFIISPQKYICIYYKIPGFRTPKKNINSV